MFVIAKVNNMVFCAVYLYKLLGTCSASLDVFSPLNQYFLLLTVWLFYDLRRYIITVYTTSDI